MAFNIMAKAAIATNDADLQTQLGLKAFLQNVPESIDHELCRRHFASVREAVAEARFLQSVEEDEARSRGNVFTVKEEVKPVEEPKVDRNQVVEACMKQLQALQANKKQTERPRSSRRKLRCWCCGEEGHTMRACPDVQQNKAAYCKQKAEKQRVPDGARECQMVSNGARGCQMMQMGARGYQMIPESARGCQMVSEVARWCQMMQMGARGYQMIPESARGCQMVSEVARWCQMMPKGVRECEKVPEGARGCQMVPESARGCQRVPDGDRGCQREPEDAGGAKWSQRVPEGARGCQMVLVGARWCQRVPEGARRARLGRSWP